jgi:hypothetical protein
MHIWNSESRNDETEYKLKARVSENRDKSD